MRKRWKILTVALVMLMLVSGLFAAVAAENDPPADPDTPVVDPILPDPTEPSETEPTDSTEPTEPSDSTEPTDTQSTEPSETEPTATEETDEPTVTETTTMPTTTVTAAKPTYTTRPTVTTTTTTETTDEIIVGDGTTTTTNNFSPLFGGPTRDPSQKAPSTDSGDNQPFEIGKVVLYSIISLIIMIGGGVAIYFITKHPATNNGKH